jgi:hypothetical protein
MFASPAQKKLIPASPDLAPVVPFDLARLAVNLRARVRLGRQSSAVTADVRLEPGGHGHTILRIPVIVNAPFGSW